MAAGRVVLINPPIPGRQVWIREGRCQQWNIWGAPFPPLSLALISSQLVHCDLQTMIIDSGPEGKSREDVLRQCETFDPEVAILATATPTLETDLGWFAEKLRSRIAKLRLAAIGVHVSVLPVEVLTRFEAIDYIIIGEPEITAKELAASILRGTPPIGQVQGVAYRKDGRSVQVNPPRPFLADLDSLLFPDWGKINFRNYPLPLFGRPFSMIVFARGCPFECKFCATFAYNGRRLRRRSVESLLNEIRFNMRWGVRDFLFWAEQMTIDRGYLLEFVNALIAEGLNREIRWVCNSRMECDDELLFAKMKEAGCWQIAFGFEFGDEQILQLARKGGRSSVKQARRAAQAAHRAGLVVDGHFILGYPGESEDTLKKTISLASSMPLTFAHFYAAVPFPGSELYEDALKNGWMEQGQWSGINQDIPILKTPKLPTDLVASYIRKAYKKFYLRPETIMRILRIPHSPREYWGMAQLGWSVLKTKVLARSAGHPGNQKSPR
jgi:anaerobic magnesium-protoporphyrin IX monomethyl ester cyclase